MKYILCSSFNNYNKDEKGKQYSKKMPNNLVEVIKQSIKKYNIVVFVANNPNTFDITDKFANLLFESLKLSNLNFKNEIVLDARNEKNARQILLNADLVFLSGGSIECQNNFFKKIKLNKILCENNIVVAASAGAINICEKSLNFPIKEEEFLRLSENNCFLDGIGIYKKIFVPHFFGDKKEYKRKNINAYNELIKLSNKKEFIAVDNNSFILVDNKEEKYFGNVYLIKCGNVEKIN